MRRKSRVSSDEIQACCLKFGVFGLIFGCLLILAEFPCLATKGGSCTEFVSDLFLIGVTVSSLSVLCISISMIISDTKN